MGSIFCSSVVLVWTSNRIGAYNFIPQKSKYSSKFSSVLQCRPVIIISLLSFLKSGVMDKLKSLRSQGYLFKTGQTFAVVYMLVWSAQWFNLTFWALPSRAREKDYFEILRLVAREKINSPDDFSWNLICCFFSFPNAASILCIHGGRWA